MCSYVYVECMYVRTYVCMYFCMYVCTYVSIYRCMYVCMYVCVYLCMYVYVCMYVCIYISMYVCMYVCTYISMHVCMYVSKYRCMYVCMCVCVYVCMYVSKYRCMYVCMHSFFECRFPLAERRSTRTSQPNCNQIMHLRRSTKTSHGVPIASSQWIRNLHCSRTLLPITTADLALYVSYLDHVLFSKTICFENEACK